MWMTAVMVLMNLLVNRIRIQDFILEMFVVNVEEGVFSTLVRANPCLIKILMVFQTKDKRLHAMTQKLAISTKIPLYLQVTLLANITMQTKMVYVTICIPYILLDVVYLVQSIMLKN